MKRNQSYHTTKASGIMCIIIIVAIICLLSVPACADTDSDQATSESSTIQIEANSNDNYMEQVTALLNSNEYDEVDVIFSDSTADDSIPTTPQMSEPKRAPLQPLVHKYVKNVRTDSDYVGKTVIATATSTPGVVISISKTKTIATTVSGSMGVSSQTISAAVGWNVTGSTSIGITGSYKIPKTYNGKKVKTGTLNAYAIYKVKKFDAYAWYQSTNKTEKLGTGTVKKAYGVKFKKSHTYY